MWMTDKDRGPRVCGGCGEEPLGALGAGHAGVHGAGALRRELHGDDRHLLFWPLPPRDGHLRGPLQRVQQRGQDLQEGHIGSQAPGSVVLAGSGSQGLHRKVHCSAQSQTFRVRPSQRPFLSHINGLQTNHVIIVNKKKMMVVEYFPTFFSLNM